MCRATHVHVDALKASHRRKLLCCSGHQVRFLTEDLHDQTGFIGVALDQSCRCRMVARGVHIAHCADHLRSSHITALLKAQQTKRPVGDPGQGGQAQADHAFFLPGKSAIRAAVCA